MSSTILTIDDLAQRWNVTPDQVRAEIRKGEQDPHGPQLRYLPIGRGARGQRQGKSQYRFRLEAVEAYEAAIERPWIVEPPKAEKQTTGELLPIRGVSKRRMRI